MILQASGLNVLYGKSRVISDLSFAVNAGSRTAVLGRNGVGKTTLLKSIMGILPLSSGTIRFDGKDIGRLKTFRRAGA